MFESITCSVSNPLGQSLRNPLCHCLISFSVTKEKKIKKTLFKAFELSEIFPLHLFLLPHSKHSTHTWMNELSYHLHRLSFHPNRKGQHNYCKSDLGGSVRGFSGNDEPNTKILSWFITIFLLRKSDRKENFENLSFVIVFGWKSFRPTAWWLENKFSGGNT